MGILRNRSSYVTGVTLIAIAAALVSWNPVVIAIFGLDSPFFFGSGWWLGVSAGILLFLYAKHSVAMRNIEVWKVAMRRILTKAMILWQIAHYGFPVFAFSATLIDISVASALVKMDLILMILITERLFIGEGRFEKVNKGTIGFLVIALAGAVSVIFSQAERAFSIGDINPLIFVLGVSLALFAAFLESLIGYGFRWSYDTSRLMPGIEGYDMRKMERFVVIMGVLICAVVATPGIAAIGFIKGEPPEFRTFALGFGSGLLLGAGSTILWRTGTLIAGNLSVNVISYIVPPLSLAWLLSLSLVGNVNIPFLLFGAAAIALSLMGINFAQRRSWRA